MASIFSKEMVEIARAAVESWYDGKVSFKGYEHDISYGRFSNLLSTEFAQDPEHSVNVFLLFGGALGNLRSPDATFGLIHDSMGRHDIFIHDQKPDADTAKRYFDFNTQPTGTPLAKIHKFIPDLLGLQDTFYTVEMNYDDNLKQRYIQIRLKVALTITFTFGSSKQSISFHKGQAILLWRSWHNDLYQTVRQFDQNGFQILQMSHADDQAYLLSISRIKREHNTY